jgi:hypothetical protein
MKPCYFASAQNNSANCLLRFRVAIFAGLFLLSACAVEPGGYVRKLPSDAEVAQYNASVEPDERIVCRRETPVGTNVPRRLCRYIRDMDDTSRLHREQLRRVLR